MTWQRANARGIAVLALVAMALQIFCTFGHFHLAERVAAKSSGENLAVASLKIGVEKASFVADADTLPSGADSDSLCPLCLVGNLVAMAVIPSPPLLVLPIAYVLLGPPQHIVRSFGIETPAFFWSRGPPIS